MKTPRSRILPATFLFFCMALLALLPTPAAAQDGDGDGLPDAFELSLAQWFFPILNLHCGTYEGLAYADKRQLYGLDVPGYTNSSNGRLPFVAHPFYPQSERDCAEPFQCIEIRYGIAWNWDLGDDIFGAAHNGDSEMYAILVARKDTDGSDWGVSWDVAKNDLSQWRLIKEFMSAHWGARGDSSSYRSHGNYGTPSYQRVWCAEGKHAMYPSQNACNNGGYADADDCGDNRCDLVTEVFQKIQNAGEYGAPLNPIIPYPSYARDVPPYGTYDVWSGASFASSTDYRSHLMAPLNWCPITSQFCQPDCNYQNLGCPAGTFWIGSCAQDCGYGPEPGGSLCAADVQCY